MTNSFTFAVIVAVIFLIGIGIGALIAYVQFINRPDGYFFVNLINPEDEMFKMQIDIPLEDLPEVKYLIFKVKKIQ